MAWEENVKCFVNLPITARIISDSISLINLDLPGTATLTVQTDSEMGYIQVNSIAITADTPGVADPGNWSGIYFKGVPILVTAVPKPGYRFSGWEGLDHEQAEITLELVENLTLKAQFTPDN